MISTNNTSIRDLLGTHYVAFTEGHLISVRDLGFAASTELVMRGDAERVTASTIAITAAGRKRLPLTASAGVTRVA